LPPIQPPEPKPPEPKPPEPKPKPQPAPVVAGPKVTLPFPAAVTSLTAGGGGRFIVFQTATGEVIVYDAHAARSIWTVRGGKPDDLIAVGRSKMFLGRAKDVQIARFDLMTGASEGSAKLEGVAASLLYMGIGSASDGPLVLVERTAANTCRIRLVDPETFATLSYPIDDPTAPTYRLFPLGLTGPPLWTSTGADGHVLMLGHRFYVRAEDKYRGGLLSSTGNVQHLPTTDGQGFVGTRMYSADGTRLPPAVLPPGTARRYLPAAGGPFVVSAEYTIDDPSKVKLFLHLGVDPKPLGELPGGAEVGAWAGTEAVWADKLHQRLIFAPDPGVLIFSQPGAASADVFPIDMRAFLSAAGRTVTFTSTPSVSARPGSAYTYRATALAGAGPVVFALEAGPPGMTMTRDGVLNWPRPGGDQLSVEVSVSATDPRGNKAVQTFRLFLPLKGAAIEPKKGPAAIEPK
jgi:hypothetical protein